MNLIQILIKKKAKIEKLEKEVDGLRKELEHLYFTYFRNLKRWKRYNTLIAYKIRKVLYTPEFKRKGHKRVLQLETQKQQLIELIAEIKDKTQQYETENISKIG